ncbi:hypothetical protein CRI93_06990 [Longimonas halophila]|uniref:Uncharacterized protein n=1 Tax=Longimonas halophila TaxID=1469170 RepID=A0A2H3P648_9BACT|nr:hypothetical protein CRI93_06990 [Longimonas halophila]
MGRILGLSAIHFAAQFVVLVLDFAAVMRRFDAPDPAAPRSFYEGVVEASWTVMSLPIARPLLEMWSPGAIGFPLSALPFILNSLVWGVALAFCWHWWDGGRKENEADGAAQQ